MSRVHYNEEMKLQTVKIVLKGEKSIWASPDLIQHLLISDCTFKAYDKIVQQ